MKRRGLFNLYQYPHQFVWTAVIALTLFNVYYGAMLKLPGVMDYACVPGAALTGQNLFFSIVLSLGTGVMAVALFELAKRRGFNARLAADGSTAGLGVLIGFLTVFCAACTIPVISVFGVAIGLSVFTTYNLILKTLALSLMGFAFWMLHQQLK